MPKSELHGKAIRTNKGNLLCCIEINGKEFFFAMNSLGGRFFFKHETERGKYLNVKEWVHDLATWPGAEIETLTGDELANAMQLAPIIAADFTAGMSPAQIAALPPDHMIEFK